MDGTLKERVKKTGQDFGLLSFIRNGRELERAGRGQIYYTILLHYTDYGWMDGGFLWVGGSFACRFIALAKGMGNRLDVLQSGLSTLHCDFCGDAFIVLMPFVAHDL